MDGFEGHPGGAFGGVEDGAGGVFAGGFALVAGFGDGVDIGAAGAEGDVHIGEFALDELEFADFLAELFALMDVGNDDIEGGLHDAEGSAGEDGALVIEAAHQDVDAAPEAAEDVLFGDGAIFEDEFAGVGAAHAELVEFLGAGEAGEGFFDDEGGDAARAGGLIGFGVDDQGIGVGAVGNPHFGAVEDVGVAVFFGAQAHGDDIRAGVGFAHGEGADGGAIEQGGQVFLLLGFGAVEVDLVDAEIGVRAVGQADGGGGAGDFFHGDGVGEVAHAGPAILFGHGDAEQADGAEFLPEIGGEIVIAIDGGGAGGDFGGGEAADGVAQGFDFRAEVKIEHGLAIGEHFGLPRDDQADDSAGSGLRASPRGRGRRR